MTGGTQALLTAVSGGGETLVLCLAAFLIFRRRGNTLAEAAACGIMAALMALSFLFQTAFLLGAPAVSMVAETVLLAAALVTIARSSGTLARGRDVTAAFFREHRAACLTLLAAWTVLGVRGFALPPGGAFWEELWPVLGFEKYGTFFATGYYRPTEGLTPVNSLILPHLFLRFNTGAGVGMFGLLAFLSIGFSTYALCRRYAWPTTAITVTMAVSSMPRLVYHAATPGVELVPVAAGLFCILALYRTVEQPNIVDLLLLITATLFGISGDRLCLLFPLILTGLSALVLYRRHGVQAWLQLIRRHWRLALPAVLPAAVFSQVWLFAFNIAGRHPWVGGGVHAFAPNRDGLTGSLANLLRYLLESAHFTLPVDMLLRKLTGLSPVRLLNSLYAGCCRPLLGNAGAAAPFSVTWQPGPALSWFGPLGFLLVLPALIYALVRGPRRLRAVAAAMMVYGYFVALIPAWLPGNARHFTLFFACCGFMGAFFLPPWRFSRRGKHGLQALSALLLLYGLGGGWLFG